MTLCLTSRRALAAATGLCLIASVGGLALAAEKSPAASASEAHLNYQADGRIALPKTYRDWPFLSSGLDMNYSDGGMAMDHHVFDNVFVDPDSLHVFQTTGTWPDGTVFVKENRTGLTKGSINKSGQFQAEPVNSLELHVKDTKRFHGDWGFFFFGSNEPAKQIPETASCYACHQAHAAVDTTFVQFYPSLIGIAKVKQTLSANYLREVEAEAKTDAAKPQ